MGESEEAVRQIGTDKRDKAREGGSKREHAQPQARLRCTINTGLCTYYTQGPPTHWLANLYVYVHAFQSLQFTLEREPEGLVKVCSVCVSVDSVWILTHARNLAVRDCIVCVCVRVLVQSGCIRCIHVVTVRGH